MTAKILLTFLSKFLALLVLGSNPIRYSKFYLWGKIVQEGCKIFYLFKKTMIILLLILFFGLFLIKNKSIEKSRAKSLGTNFIIYLTVKREIPDDEIEIYSSAIKDKIESLELGKVEAVIKKEDKGLRYYLGKFFEKMGSIFESLAGGFAGIIGGYAANKIISKIENEPGQEQAQP